jgi:hypothetical protein
MADFGAPPVHTEILLPLGGKHILSPKPPDDRLGTYRISETEVSDRRELSSISNGFPLTACGNDKFGQTLNNLEINTITFFK